MSDEFDLPEDSTDAEGIKRDRWGRYVLPDPITGKQTWFTRCTTLAKGVDDTYLLDLWKQRMVAYGIAISPDLVAAVSAAGLKDRSTLNKMAEKAHEVAGGTTRARLGTALHKFCEQYDRGETVTCPPGLQPELDAYTELVVTHGLEYVEIEPVMVNPEFKAAGKPDRIVRLTRTLEFSTGKGKKKVTLRKGTLLILDLKTGSTLDFGGGAIAAQLAVYANSVGIWNVGVWSGRCYQTMPDVDRSYALVVHLPVRDSESGPATASLRLVNIGRGYQAVQVIYQLREWRSQYNRHVMTSADSCRVILDSDPATALPSQPGIVIDGGAFTKKELHAREASGVQWRTLECACGYKVETTDTQVQEVTCMVCMGVPPANDGTCLQCGRELPPGTMGDTCPVCTTLVFQSRRPACPACGRWSEDSELCLVCTGKVCGDCGTYLVKGHCESCNDEPEQLDFFERAVNERRWSDAINLAENRAELSRVWRSAREVGAWTKELEEQGRKRRPCLD